MESWAWFRSRDTHRPLFLTRSCSFLDPTLPSLWAAAQRPGALSRGSPGLWRDRLFLAAGQMEPQWWGLLPACCAQGVSAFKAAFVPGACSRKNRLAAPQQESVRPLGSTGSAPSQWWDPGQRRPQGATFSPATAWPGGRTVHQGGNGEDGGLWVQEGGRAWGLVQPCFDPQSPGQHSGYPGQPLPASAGKWPRV